MPALETGTSRISYTNIFSFSSMLLYFVQTNWISKIYILNSQNTSPMQTADYNSSSNPYHAFYNDFLLFTDRGRDAHVRQTNEST